MEWIFSVSYTHLTLPTKRIDDLGNLAILDIHKKNKEYLDKRNDYLSTGNEELKKFLSKNRDGISYTALQERTEYKKQLLVDFFKATNK